MATVNCYPGFEYSANQLHKFIGVLDFFTIIFNDGNIVHFTAKDANSFRQWLLLNQVKGIRTEDGWIVS